MINDMEREDSNGVTFPTITGDLLPVSVSQEVLDPWFDQYAALLNKIQEPS